MHALRGIKEVLCCINLWSDKKRTETFNQFCLYFKSFADSQTIVRPVNLAGASGRKSVVSSRQIFIWKMSLCQVYSFMPGVVIELTTSALKGLSERTAKCLERLGKSYSFYLWRKGASLKFDVTFLLCERTVSYTYSTQFISLRHYWFPLCHKL